MARPLRLEFPGALYHITARGNEKRVIFKDDSDCRVFERLLSELPERFGIVIHCYVLMNNHYHLLLETAKANLSKSIHYLNATYTGYFNKRHRRVGHLLQGRYKAILVEKSSYLLALSRYIHLNPYRAGIVRQLERYLWSSYPGYIRQDKAKDWVNYDWILCQFSKEMIEARRLHQEFVLEGLKGKIENPLIEVQKGFILGAERFITEVAERVKGKIHREIPDSQRFREVVTLEKVSELVSRYFKVEEAMLTMRGSKGNLARRIAIYLARQHTYESNSNIGRYFNIGYTAVSQVAGGLKREMEEDKELRQTIQGLETKLK